MKFAPIPLLCHLVPAHLLSLNSKMFSRMRLANEYRKGLGWQLLISILSIYFLITFVVTIAQMGIEYFEVRNQIYQRLQNVERIYYPTLATSLWELNTKQVDDLQEKILALSFVSAIRIIDEQGHDTFKSKGDVRPGVATVSHTFSLNYRDANANAHLADVTLMTTYGVVFDLLKVSYQLIVVNALIKSLALTILFIWIFKKRLSAPLGKLTSQIETINLNSLEKTRINLDQPEINELSQLERAFNSMLSVLDAERKKHAAHLEKINEELERQVISRTEQLALANQKLESLVGEDPMTGIANRRFFFEQADIEIQRALRSGPLSLLMLDLDNFKDINDTWGHPVGDEVLKNFVVAAGIPLRATDLLARIGGEEFAILLPNTTVEGAKVLAERVLETVRRQTVEGPGGSITYTVSVGVAVFHGAGDDLPALLKRADAALYKAKEQGRNRSEVFQNE